MKSLLSKCLFFALVVALVMSTGCGLLPAGESGAGKPAVEKQAIDTLAQFSIVSELATLETLEIFSEGFT